MTVSQRSLLAICVGLALTAGGSSSVLAQGTGGSGWGEPVFNLNRRTMNLASQSSPSASDRPAPMVTDRQDSVIRERPAPKTTTDRAAPRGTVSGDWAVETYDPAWNGPPGAAYGCDSRGCGCGGAMSCVAGGCRFGGCDGRGGDCGCDSCQSELTCCDTGSLVPRNWFEADYLGWWTKGNPLPALVTTSPAGTARADAGVVGAAGTRVLFGNEQIDDEYRSGMRFTLGRWLDPDGCLAIQASYFAVFDDENTGDYANRTAGAIGAGIGAPILARPFFNVGIAPNREDARLVSFPGVTDGSITINSSSEIQSGSLLLRQHFRSDASGRFDLIGGYRYFRLREGLLIQENQTRTELAVPIPVGTTYAYQDYFRAENEFHGGDLGIIAQRWSGLWTIEILAKVALGNLHRSAAIAGSNSIDTPPAGGAVTTPGGLLALPTNIGTRTANDFAALPEVGINVKYDPSRAVSVQFGYTFLALNDVTRTGELIDRVVNSTQTDGNALVGAARPMSLFGNQTDFWAQGFNVGLTVTR